MAAARTFHIRPVLHGQTLSPALRRLIPRHSPADVKGLIAGRYVQLNGNVVTDDNRRLKTGDVVKVFAHALAAPATEDDIRVRFADQHLVVIEKPPGVTTLRQHDEPRGRHDRMATLVEMLQRVMTRRHGPAASPSAPKLLRHKDARHPLVRRAAPPPSHRGAYAAARRGGVPTVRAVHRLDRDTSGLMIFALSADAEHALTRLFKEHAIERKYFAVVQGHPAEQTIESYLVRDRGDGLRGSTSRGKKDPGAQHAITHVRPIERVGDYTVIECRLETGRTHQIRIHLAEAGHALCGEKTYTRRSPTAPQPAPDRSGAPRQALHSAELYFTHPLTDCPLHFRSPFPHDLSQWLRTLRGGKPERP